MNKSNRGMEEFNSLSNPQVDEFIIKSTSEQIYY